MLSKIVIGICVGFLVSTVVMYILKFLDWIEKKYK
jgi:tetrahydromethanopterin S-methyltransferase subunit F